MSTQPGRRTRSGKPASIGPGGQMISADRLVSQMVSFAANLPAVSKVGEGGGWLFTSYNS